MYSRREIRLTLATMLMMFAIMVAGAFGDDYYVPSGIATIQLAIDACGTGGDTIYVAPGTYYENIVIDGDENDDDTVDRCNITIIGQGSPHYGPTIDGGGCSAATPRRVITIKDQTHHITIKNFKITNGCPSASDLSGDGGGILVYGGTPEKCEKCYDIYLIDLEVVGNSAQNGGGIACYRSVVEISECCVHENHATGTGDDGVGGGLYLDLPAGADGSIGYTVRDCCIFHNHARKSGGGVQFHADDSLGEIVNCLVRQNSIGTTDNGAGIHCSSSETYVKNCTIADNYHEDDTMLLWGSPNPTKNVYGVWMDPTEHWMKMIHCIVYFNGPADFDDMNISKPTIFVMYSDVDMNLTKKAAGTLYPDWVSDPTNGTNNNTNYDFDPEFDWGDFGGRACDSEWYFLQKASPCVDAGIPAYEDEWGQTHCDLVNTHPDSRVPPLTTCDKSPDPYYSVHVDGEPDLDKMCDQGTGACGPNVGLIDLGYHYDYQGMNCIELASFSANVHSDKVVLKWETATEMDNAGFLVYRCANEASGCTKISDFIAANGDAVGGATYSFTDTNVAPGAGYYYWLVDIDTSGEWTAHGPVSARLPMSRLKPIQPPSAFAQSFGGQATTAAIGGR